MQNPLAFHGTVAVGTDILTKSLAEYRAWLIRVSGLWAVPRNRAVERHECGGQGQEMSRVADENHARERVAEKELADTTQKQQQPTEPDAAGCRLRAKCAA